MKNAQEFALRSVKSAVATARATLEKFAADLLANPAYNMAWSDKAFDAAAVVEQGDIVLATFDRIVELGDMDESQAIRTIIGQLTRDVIQASRYAPSSSSVGANAMELATRRAKVVLIEMLEFAV